MTVCKDHNFLPLMSGRNPKLLWDLAALSFLSRHLRLDVKYRDDYPMSKTKYLPLPDYRISLPPPINFLKLAYNIQCDLQLDMFVLCIAVQNDYF